MNRYFCAETEIERYEEFTGKKVTDCTKKLIREVEGLLNKAFEDGFAAGLEAANDRN